MDKQTIETLVSLLDGITSSEWARVKQQVDRMFSSEAAKVKLGNVSQLKQNLEVEFSLRRFGEEAVEIVINRSEVAESEVEKISQQVVEKITRQLSEEVRAAHGTCE